MPPNLPFLDTIWRVKSSLELDEPMSSAEAFERLEPLFQTEGTDYSADGETLTYRKKNPGAQDKLATFPRGNIKVAQHEAGTRLDYDLSSMALFWCFLAPFAFLLFAQLTVLISELEKPGTDARETSAVERGADAEDEDEDEVAELHWIDQALGAPAPQPPSKQDKKAKAAKPTHSPTTAYVLAGIFAVVFAVGRVLEPWLVKRTFRKALSNKTETETMNQSH